MIQLNPVVRTLLPVLAFVLLSGVALLASPEPAEAQDCSECQFNGRPDPWGIGSFRCVWAPEGYRNCHLGPNYCQLEDECQEITHLDFREDGTAFRPADPRPSQEDGSTRDRTCDGVLLGTRAPTEFEGETASVENRHALIL